MARTDKPRERALQVLRFCEQGVFADELMAESRSAFDQRDNAFILELVYGVLRNQAFLDWILDRFSKQPVRETDAWTRNILRLGAYQLLFLDKVPPSAAVNTSTDLSKRFGKKPGYINGLLRHLERNKQAVPSPDDDDPVKRLAVRHSHPEWLVRRWLARFGLEKTEEALRRNNRPAPLTVRTNTLKTSREGLTASLESEGAEVREAKYSLTGLEIVASPGLRTLAAYREGLFMVQDEAAQLVGAMLAPQPGELVLDACAAPGGKATHIAELMKNEGMVVALEPDEIRIKRITENSERLGITIIRPVPGDATRYAEGGFDKVLIDAPCSGLGLLRRHPDGRWNKSVHSIGERAAVQRRIIGNCSKLLKPGGALVYATCTTEPEENEELVNDFLAGPGSSFSMDDPVPFLPLAAKALVDAKGFFRTFPEAPEMDGFFGARMVKNRQGL